MTHLRRTIILQERGLLIIRSARILKPYEVQIHRQVLQIPSRDKIHVFEGKTFISIT
jgi:hypothetical protein